MSRRRWLSSRFVVLILLLSTNAITFMVVMWLLRECHLILQIICPPCSYCTNLVSRRQTHTELKPMHSSETNTHTIRFSQLNMQTLAFYSLGYYSRLGTYGNPVYTRCTNLTQESVSHLPTVFVITPTYKRLTQKVDLTSLCHTLMHVPELHWIVVEDSDQRTDLVAELLRRCDVASTHLAIKRPWMVDLGFAHYWRGMEQRNLGLSWIRAQCGVGAQSMLTQGVLNLEQCSGVVYFADDDNKYDLRLFDEIRHTLTVSVWPVAYAALLYYEGPICMKGKVSAWHTAFARGRPFPIDMAGFAINFKLLLDNPGAVFTRSKLGFMETNFLKQFRVSVEELECKGVSKEALVWHIKTETPNLSDEVKSPSDPKFET